MTADRERIERDGYLIRTFEPHDAAAAWDLHVEGLRDMNTWRDEEDRDPKWDADVRAIPEHYLIPGSHFWVVEPLDPGRQISVHPEPVEGPSPSPAEAEPAEAGARSRHYPTPNANVAQGPSPERPNPIIATNAITRIDDTTARLRRMRVAKTHRRRGIARLLVDIAEDFCRRNNYQRIILDTTNRQQPAQHLYESLNYTRTHEEPLPAIGLTLIHYQKPL